jgi:hypothetical protein
VQELPSAQLSVSLWQLPQMSILLFVQALPSSHDFWTYEHRPVAGVHEPTIVGSVETQIFGSK